MVDVPNHGVSIQLSDMAATPVFTAIGQVVSITPPNLTRGTVDVPAHSDTGGVPVFPDALYKGGPVNVRIKHDPADPTHDPTTGLREAMIDGLTRDWQLILPDTGATQYAFAGYVTNWNHVEMPVNVGVSMVDVVIEVDGDIGET